MRYQSHSRNALIVGGKGRVESWSGGYESCRTCGGDGEVCNWLGIGVLVVLAFAVWNGSKGGKKG